MVVRFFCQKKSSSSSSQSTYPRGPLALQINKAGSPDSSSAALLLRERAETAHDPAARSRVINGQGHARPARGPRRPILLQLRRRWALSSTAKPALRPPTCGCSTGPRTSRPRAAPPRPVPSAGTHHTAFPSTGASPRATKAQDKAPRQAGSKTASRAAHDKRNQPTFSNKCDAHLACRCDAAWCSCASRDEQLAVFVLQNNSTAEQGVRGGGGIFHMYFYLGRPAVALKETAQCGHRRVRHVRRAPWKRAAAVSPPASRISIDTFLYDLTRKLRRRLLLTTSAHAIMAGTTR